MKSTTRETYKRPSKKIKGKDLIFKRGAGVWMQVYCPNGHLLAQLRYGTMTEGQQLLKAQGCKCTKCAEGN